MIQDAFRSVSTFIRRTADDIVETAVDIAKDNAPVALKTLATGETANLPFFVFNSVRQLAQAKSESETRDTTRDQRIEEKNMPHVEGHMPMELPPMTGHVSYESPSEAFIGGLNQVGRELIRRGLSRLNTPGGAAATGVAGGVVGNMLTDSSDVCGCQPKPFVRFNKCNKPIITRKMKKQAIEAINCNGPEIAAATLTGGDLELLTEIVSKQFPPMKRGISGAQLSNAAKTARRLDRMHTQFMKMCKPKRGR